MRRIFVGFLLALVACTAGDEDHVGTLVVEPRLYVMLRVDGGWNLTDADVMTGELTGLFENVSGFAPIEEDFIVVSDGGSTLGRWDGEHLQRLWECVGECRDPVPSPTGDFLAWVEESARERQGWVIDLAGGEAKPVGDIDGRPVWSPGGDRLAFLTREGLAIWSIDGGLIASLDLPLLTAQPSWSATGDQMAIVTAGGKAVSIAPHQLARDSQMTLLQPLGDDGTIAQVSELAWSPKGEQVALLRRRFFPPVEPQTDKGEAVIHQESSGVDALGPQPWLLLLNENRFLELPGDPGATFARPVWSPDGQYLAAVRLPMGTPDPQPEVWVWASSTGRLVQRFVGAAAPAWGGN